MTQSGEPPATNLTGLRFEKILMVVERDLQSALDKARLESGHGPSVGDRAEAAVRTALRSFLPSGFGVGHGHVYDAYGDGSRQTDVIITNPDHPLSFPVDTAGTYVVDGVAAAGEVKSVLDVGSLSDCLAKGAEFKRLRMTANSTDQVLTRKHSETIKHIGLVPPFFVIAFENKIAIETLTRRLHQAELIPPPTGKSLGERDDGNASQPPIDAVCILGRGIFLNARPGNPMGIKIKPPPEIAEPMSDWGYLPTAAPLAWLLAWMNATMPRIHRGGSVFGPYLIPNLRHLQYMAGQESFNLSADQ
ncbi:hypothetical protein A5722_02360 [Mycobacterium vulneris]|nr:hypothetical protein A5722_02360 [Mycolicibacterium vulneris]OCB67256.1 hypothetical protein A5729_07965 [Mycolicibacterium vulneris]